jgi:hypothetical protein
MRDAICAGDGHQPAGLECYKLAVDAEGEVTRCRQALGDIPITILVCEQNGQAASLNNLRAALRDGLDILYLVAYGTNRGGQPYLWLEQEDGTIDRISGNDFSQSLADLERRPPRPRSYWRRICVSRRARI